MSTLEQDQAEGCQVSFWVCLYYLWFRFLKIRIILSKFLLIAAFTLQSQVRRALCGGQERNLRRSQLRTSKHPTTSKQEGSTRQVLAGFLLP